MTASSKINAQLRDALRLTSASWVALADREGGKWNMLASQRLSRAAQTHLLRLVETDNVDTWLCSALSGGNSRSASLPLQSGLNAPRLCAFPVPHSTRVLLVGAEGLSSADQRVWRMQASLLSEQVSVQLGQSVLPEVLSSLPYDLPRSMERILSAFVQAVQCQSAWLAIRRGDALEVQVEWNDAKEKGASFHVDSNELLRRVNRTLAEVAAVYGQPEWDMIPTTAHKRGARVWICLPLVIGQRQIGAVAMWRTRELTHVEWQILRDLASHVASSVEVAVTFSEMGVHLRRLGMLNDFALTISSAQNLDQIARRVFDLLARAFGTEMVALSLLSIDGRMVREYKSRERKIVTQMMPVNDHPVASFLRKTRTARSEAAPNNAMHFMHENARSSVMVPLKYRGQVIGTLTIESPRPKAFSQYDENLMVVIASHLAGLVEYGRLREEAEGRARSLGLIHEVVQQVIGLNNMQEMAQITADLLAQYFGYELAAVLFEDRTQKLTVHGFGGKYARVISKVSADRDLSLYTGITGYVFSTGESLLVNDTSLDPRYQALQGWDAASEICVPLRDNERVFGIIDIESSQPNAFSNNDMLAIESLAGILSAVVSSSDQYQRLQETVRQLRQTQIELKARMDAQRAAENRLIQAAKLAAVGEMAAGIAHELNNPLTTVTGFTELILDDLPVDASYRSELEMVQREARRATDVVRRLLDFSRQGERTRTRADLNEIVEDVVALTHHLIQTSGVQLVLEPGGDLPWVSVDRNQMKQVLLNLIHNALQAMPAGGSLFLITESRTREGRSWVSLSVRDTGVGIPARERDRVFEPFFTTKGERGGTGLGLSVTYGIVTDHGGVIDVESEPGVGSTFTVWLPL
jgi:signal transduction histidine kinase